MKLCIIGLGKMGTTLLYGILDNNILEAKDIIGCDPVVDEREHNKDYRGIRTTGSNYRGVEQADNILLAVKPQVLKNVLQGIKPASENKLFISIAAGVSTDRIKENLPESCRVIRVMPNTPALVNQGVSAISPGEKATDDDIEFVKKICNGVGKGVVIEEHLIDAVTGLSGSGPAYIYVIIEALADAGVLNGLSRDLALELAVRTVAGSAEMVLKTGQHPGQLKDMVTSPGGTTINGLQVIEKRGLRGILMEAVSRAVERSRELGEE